MSYQGYWTVSEGPAIRTQTCRECRGTIHKDEPVKVRDGRKIRLFYHMQCFSGDADPRTQGGSSYHDQRFADCNFAAKAPPVKGRGKWSVDSYGYNPSLVFAGSRNSIAALGKAAKSADNGS
ncbi:hypothetical protein DFS34DRAFT_711518, partial [Phlyctochytrium arcticum]